MINSGSAWAPIVPNTALSDMHADQVKGTLKRRPAGTLSEFDTRDGYQCGVAYAHWETEGQFDISVDTVPECRRQGLARVAVSKLIRTQGRCGRRPVWGAMASNIASQRLAERLGFRIVDEVVLFRHVPQP